MAREWDLRNPSKVVLSMGDFNGHVGRRIDGFEGVHGSVKLAEEMLSEENYSSFVMKRSCAWQIHGLKRRSRVK